MRLSPNLKTAIENLYRTFSALPKPRAIEGCPCCISRIPTDALLSKPLKSLSPDDLTLFASSALLTVGGVDELKYFLPRILEIVVESDGWWPDVEVIGARLNEAEFQNWPTGQRQGVMTFFDEVFAELLAEGNSIHDLDAWICALGNMRLDLSPYLSRIQREPVSLVQYYEMNSMGLQLANAFWTDAPEQTDQVLAWFASVDVKAAIEEYYRTQLPEA